MQHEPNQQALALGLMPTVIIWVMGCEQMNERSKTDKKIVARSLNNIRWII